MRGIHVMGRLALTGLFSLFLINCGGGYGSGYSSSSGGSSGDGTITSIRVSPTSATIAVGGTQQFTAVTKNASGNTVTGASLVWKSSDTNVATVDNTGLVTAKAAGSTNITASITYNGGIYGNTPITYTSNTAKLTVTAMNQVMGTAAVGHPLAGALVTLVDARGQTASTLSGDDGHFRLSVAGYQAPFLLKAEDGRGLVLFGAAKDAGVANIDTLTDFVLQAVSMQRGIPLTEAFTHGAAAVIPNTRALAELDSSVADALRDTLVRQGLEADHFSLFSTPFDANGSGFDAVLDHVSVTAVAGDRTLRDGISGMSLVIHSEHGALQLESRSPDRPQLTSVRRLSVD